MNSRLMAAALGCAVLVLGAVVLQSARREPPSLRSASAATPLPSLRRVALDGADVARLLRLDAYKWTYRLPASGSRKIWMSLWAEDWRRTAKKPRLIGLGALGGLRDSGTLAINLPRGNQSELVYATQFTAAALNVPEVKITGAHSFDAAENEVLAFDRDVILVARTQSANGMFSSDYKSPDFTRRHDRTVFIKARFTRGDRAGQPVWSGGKVVLK
jgi:hypothetical protein